MTVSDRRQRMNLYMKNRRAKLRREGICVDCQNFPVEPAKPGERPHVCCHACLEARRQRWRDSQPTTLPLFPDLGDRRL